jgi:Cof subfamily protein (haloacid dehalogenase superfamily)
MPRYQLLAIDIDGTLVNSRDELTAPTCAALARAGEAGIHVGLATGRRYSHTLHLVEPLGIDVPLVTAGGALVKDPLDHRTLFCAHFDREVICQALTIVERCGYDVLLCADTFTRGFDYYQAAAAAKWPEMARYLAMNSGCGRLWPNMMSDPPPDVFGGFAIGSQRQMLDLESRLHEAMPGKIATNVLHSPRFNVFMCELAPAGVTKWSAIRRLAGQWGIREEAICAVGDDVNDIAMIRGAGLGVAMGNALPIVKEAASRIAPTHDENGLVQVVQWLLE